MGEIISFPNRTNVEKIRLEILGLSASQSQPGTFALVLGEVNGNRRLPIIIGGFEAQAIAMEIENIKPNRPLTHDLIVSIASSFDIDMEEVVISDLRDGVFYSKIIFHLGIDVKEVDARPSDAIAVAVRYKAPIYTTETVLQEAGIVVQDAQPRATVEKVEDAAPAESSTSGKQLSLNQQIKMLTTQIEDAINREDYEKAARLRDDIKRLENPNN
jgi:uncharacterized protein